MMQHLLHSGVLQPGTTPSVQRQPGKLKACPQGWKDGEASTWKCNEAKMGTTCEGCGVTLDAWPEKDSCRKISDKSKSTPRSCLCDEVINKVGTKVAAFKPKQCGGQLQVMDRDSGTTETVTVVDAGPYAKGRVIDIHEDVFGRADLFHVCVSPYKDKTDNQLSPCWDGFGGEPPAKRGKNHDSSKKHSSHGSKKPHKDSQ